VHSIPKDIAFELPKGWLKADLIRATDRVKELKIARTAPADKAMENKI
jgi:hypothetical protein